VGGGAASPNSSQAVFGKVGAGPPPRVVGRTSGSGVDWQGGEAGSFHRLSLVFGFGCPGRVARLLPEIGGARAGRCADVCFSLVRIRASKVMSRHISYVYFCHSSISVSREPSRVLYFHPSGASGSPSLAAGILHPPGPRRGSPDAVAAEGVRGGGGGIGVRGRLCGGRRRRQQWCPGRASRGRRGAGACPRGAAPSPGRGPRRLGPSLGLRGLPLGVRTGAPRRIICGANPPPPHIRPNSRSGLKAAVVVGKPSGGGLPLPGSPPPPNPPHDFPP